MNILIDVGLIAMCFLAIVVLLKELSRSQKYSEDMPFLGMYMLTVELQDPSGAVLRYVHEDWEFMQGVLNNIQQFRIKTAVMTQDGKLIANMDARGILQPV